MQDDDSEEDEDDKVGSIEEVEIVVAAGLQLMPEGISLANAGQVEGQQAILDAETGSLFHP